MKRFSIFAMVTAISMSFIGCSSSAMLSQTNIIECEISKPIKISDIMADLEVSPNKITYFYVPSQAVSKAGHTNVLKTAVREALIANGNADVLVHLDEQTKFNSDGEVESITVSGYPAKYVNFRSVNERYVLEMAKLYEELNLKLTERVVEADVPNLIPDLQLKTSVTIVSDDEDDEPSLSKIKGMLQGKKQKK